MTSEPKYMIVSWRLLWRSDLFWSLLCLLRHVSGLFMVVGESTPGLVPGEVA
jgi:hypothetical protein